jgi:hypothetical protein
MRRALVLTNEAARHPFRQNLRPTPTFVVKKRMWPSRSDVTFFGISFSSFFIVIYGMIA